MKNLRFKIKDLGLKKRIIYVSLSLLIYLSLIFNLQSLNFSVQKVFADVTQTQNIGVSAFIGPHTSDFQFDLADQNGATTIHQGEFHTYVVTYGVKSSAKVSTNDVITVSFARDLAPNGQHIFDYQFGSASDGYGGAKPVIDLVNRTITWNISALPAGTTDQKVYFNVFTNTYQTTGSFDVFVTATMSNEYVTMPDQTLVQHYRYQTPIPGPTATPAPQPTAIPTPTPPPPPPPYNVSINGINGTSATIQITTTNPTKVSVSYGTSPGNLNQTVSTGTFQNDSTLTLANLEAGTTYYFRIKITNEDGSYYITELFSFKTASQALSALPLTSTAVISSNGTVLLSEPFSQNMNPGFALLTSSFGYDVTVSLPQNGTYKSVETIIGQQHPITTAEMTQQQQGIYEAQMQTLPPGTYSISIRTLDDTGTLIEQKIATLRVIAPLSVTDRETGSPLANTRIFLSYFDQTTNTYKPLSAGMFGVQSNPGYTDDNGIYAINLPPGKYRAEARALFYDNATVDFTLGKNDGETFPHIILTKNPTNIMALLMVIKDYIMDNLTSAFAALQTIATSSRVFHVVATAATGSLILLTYLFFLLKSHTSLKNLPLLLFVFIDVVLRKHTGKYLFGKVTDANGLALSLVRVEVEDTQSKTILHHTTTNKTGKFYFTNKFPGPINLLFIKEGFQPENRSLPTNGFPEQGLKIILETGQPHHSSALKLIGSGFRDILGMLFETALVLSIILEIAFFFFYGFEKTAPFLILSIINIILWLFYRHQAKN